MAESLEPEALPRKFPCTLRVCGRKKLPFAGYSVVKDHTGGIRPSESLTVALGTTSPGPPWFASLAPPTGVAPFRSP